MIVKSSTIETSWVDPDDAPELTGDEMNRPDAVWSIEGQQVTPDEGKAAFRKILKSDSPVSSTKKGSAMKRFNTVGASAFSV